MKTVLIFLVIISTVLTFATTATAKEYSTYNAKAILKDANGHTVGKATFTQDASGPVNIKVSVSGLKPGMHGIHIHNKGICKGPLFTSAGEHYNPMGKQHGLLNPEGPHAGDLPNLGVGVNGKGYMNVSTRLVTLSPGQNTLFAANGTSLVIHSSPDDLISNPAGNSGVRNICGVIKKEKL